MKVSRASSTITRGLLLRRISAGLVVSILTSCASICTVKNAQHPDFEIPGRKEGVRYSQIMAIGDVGTGEADQRMVAGAMATKAAADPVTFVLLLGDNFYENGVDSVTDPQFKLKFEDMYDHASLQVPFLSVLGNHDYRGDPEAQVQYTAISKRWKMPSRYYAFEQNIDDSTRIDFFALDTTPIAQGEARAAGQIAWLQGKLERSRARWKIVIGHHPLYSGGLHGNDTETLRMRAVLEPLLEGKADLYIGGHDHDQQLIRPAGKSVHYLISGAGSKCRSVRWLEDTIYAGTNLGFVWLRISRDEILIEFLTANAEVDFAYVIKRIGET